MSSSTVQVELEAALQAGKEAILEGREDGVSDGAWVLSEMRDVYLALHELKKQEVRAQPIVVSWLARIAACLRASHSFTLAMWVQTEELDRARRREQLNALSGRTDKLGIDQYGRRYWAFEIGGLESRLWVQPRTPEVQRVRKELPPDATSEDAWQFFEGDEVHPTRHAKFSHHASPSLVPCTNPLPPPLRGFASPALVFSPSGPV